MAKTKEAKLAKKAAAKEAKKEKQLIKAHKKQTKELGLTTEECDIQVLLQQFQQQSKQKTHHEAATGKLVPCSQPSPRSACTLTPLPTGEFLLFGGEFYEGSKAVVYNETYRWNVDKDIWRLVDCPLSPPPRCSHQAAAFKDSVFVFGGEFATVEQFYHFRDLWRFDVKTSVWEEIKYSGTGPSARSGHRMVVYKNQLVVFGGFHDTLRETRYFNDVYILSLQTYRWSKVILPSHAQAPSPRSGVMMAAYPQGEGILVYGGYCKLKDTTSGAQGRTLQDSWWLNMKRAQEVIASKSPLGGVWERLGKKACLPAMRSGASMVTYKAMAVVFGGVCDEDHGGTSLRSVFYNDLYAFDLERKKWFPLKIRSSQAKSSRKHPAPVPASPHVDAKLTAQQSEDGSDEPQHRPDDTFECDSEDDDSTTFGYIDQDGRLVRIKIDMEDQDEADDNEAAPVLRLPPKILQPSSLDKAKLMDDVVRTTAVDQQLNSNSSSSRYNEDKKNTNVAADCSSITRTQTLPLTDTRPLEPDTDTPLPRLNACVVMKGTDLLIYGGIVELGSKELTLDDCWSININQRQQWKCVLKGHLDEHPWNEEAEEDNEGDASSENGSATSEDEFSEATSSSDDSSDSVSRTCSDSDVETPYKSSRKSKRRPLPIREEMAKLQKQLECDVPERMPKFQETLREFFDRSKDYWIARHLECQKEPSALRLWSIFVG